MTNDLLHILNGDSTRNKFEHTDIPGRIMVWNETLAIGPLFYQLDSGLFWEMRSQFMEKVYGSKLGEYKRKIIHEFQKLRIFQGDEIVLWYEYDVFCQVNYIALMSYILRKQNVSKISIVCVGDFPESKKRLGLGEISTELYPELFKDRITLKRSDLMDADRAWMMWCGKMIEQFSTFEPIGLPYLKDALEASKILFATDGNESELESSIRSMVSEGSMKEREIIRHLLINDEALGFGDSQFEYLLNKVKNHP